MQDPKSFDALAILDRELLEKRALAFVRLRDGGDFEALLKMMDSNVVFEPCLPWRPGPAKSECEGKVAVEAMLRQRHREYQSIRSSVQNVLADQGYVVVRRTTRLRHRGTNATGVFSAVDVLRFSEGLIVALAEYTDTAAVERLSADQPVS